MSKKDINIEIGKRIHIAREDNHYTQEVLAEKLDLSTQYLSDVERGVTGISVATLMKLCEVLHTSSDYLLFGIEYTNDLKGSLSKIEHLSRPQQRIVKQAIDTVIEAINMDNGQTNN